MKNDSLHPTFEILDYLTSNYTKATSAAYLKEINHYRSNNENAANYHYRDILNYIGVLRKRYTNIKTLNRILACIKAYYNYLVAVKIRTDNPAQSILLKDKRSNDIQLQDLFTNEELESLLKRKERYSLLVVRNEVLIGLLIYQALLPKEIAALKVNDIDLKTGTVFIEEQAKTNSRTLALKPQQVMLLLNYINDIRKKLLQNKEHNILVVGSHGNGFTADEITKHIKRSFKSSPLGVGGRAVTPIKIRQSVIVNLLAQSHDIRSVQVFAGHKKASTTEQYKQANTQALKEQINQYHPIK